MRGSQSCGHCVPLVACRPRLPLSCFVETVLRFLLRTKYKHTDAHANTQIHARVLSPFRPVFVCLVLNRTHASGIRPSTSSTPWSPSVSLSSVSFPSSVFHLLSLLPRFQLCYTAKEYKEQQAGYKYSLPTQDC